MKFYLLAFPLVLFAEMIDLNSLAQDFVLETKRVEVPGYPYAFNPSMVRWRNFILMSFRTIPDPKKPFTCWIGVILLDQEFNPIGDAQILSTRDQESPVPPRGEDARLFFIGDKLYIAYSDNPYPKITGGGFRMVLGELVYGNGLFSIHELRRLEDFEGRREDLREKNWVPFEYNGRLHLAYSISPHRIFYPVPGTSTCKTVAETATSISCDWGILRGGTSALPIETGEYLSFFHSVKRMATVNSKEKEVNHYFIGAYTFSSKPPFQILRCSPCPIVGPGFYSGASYKPYWGSILCVFPAGLIIDSNFIWISYGRQDHEIWVAKLHKQKLLDSLIPVSP